MATETVAGGDTPAYLTNDGAPRAPLFQPLRLEDMTGAAVREHQLQRLVDRVGGVSRGAAVLVDMLDHDASAAEYPDDQSPGLCPAHRGAVAGLLRESLHMLADEIGTFAEICRANGGAR